MNDGQVNIAQANEHWNAAGNRLLKYTVEVFHRGLQEHKVISAPELDMLENKVELQIQKWAGKWKKYEDKRLVNEKRLRAQNEKEASIKEAESLTDEAKKALEIIDNILVHTLSINDAVDWNDLKNRTPFKLAKPLKPSQPFQKSYPARPDKNTLKFQPTFTLLEKVIKSKKQKKEQQFEEMFVLELAKWEKDKKNIDLQNKNQETNYEKDIAAWNFKVTKWENQKEKFLGKQAEYNRSIEFMKAAYSKKDAAAIVEYCEIVLNNSDYPETFPQNFELEYSPENKILIIEYELPSLEDIPKVKDVKYVATKKEMKETYLSSAQLTKIFDDTLYKITLRTLHEIFEADVIGAIDAVSFNGWVKAINKATGTEENNCIVSIQASKENFMKIDLAKVDPKSCFKGLKGVAASKLSSISAIQPILQISKHDKRFVESYSVTNQIDSATNLAAMDWEDFEHLVRELFEKEFQVNGGEVNVTQASSDGGVDAIAFDPDPIRGGKIVIQAKRYTNTVGVSAVRDLYGTVMNEGATKGILVSTANYGPDAYEFAKGKPITLLNGSNLLHLLEKHGHHAKIDLKEAKRLLMDKG